MTVLTWAQLARQHKSHVRALTRGIGIVMPAPSILPYDAATFLWFTEPLLLAENRSDSVRFSEFTCSIFELEGEVGEARAGARALSARVLCDAQHALAHFGLDVALPTGLL